ncbi:MAG: Hpt domain-containing protein [Kiritimatiellae bacterium]|nr:Hpt domain-containing protein [Kiritimatiellia bacterium]
MKQCCEKYLNEQFGNDAEVVNAIYAEYVSSVNVKAAEADEALAAVAWDALDKVAHTIKGNSLAVGDQQMADTAIELRNAAKLQDRDQAERLIADLRALEKQL